MSAPQSDKPEDVTELIKKLAVATTLGTQKADDVVPDSNVALTNKITDTLFAPTKRKMLGILSGRQIAGIKKLYLLNDIIFENKQSVLTRIINNEIDLSVSENGVGREQLVKLTKVDDPIEPQMGRIKRYFQ